METMRLARATGVLKIVAMSITSPKRETAWWPLLGMVPLAIGLLVGDGPAFLAGVHVNAALGHASNGGIGSMVEWRYFDLEARLYGNEAIPRDGSIAVPQSPGLGFDPDPEIVRRYRAD